MKAERNRREIVMMSTEKNLQDIISLMQRDSSVDAPADSIRWATNLFRTRAAEPKKSLIQKIVAVMQMEIAPNKAAFGERSAATSAAKQMLFRAGDAAVDLRIEEAKKGFDVTGQILGPDFSGATITLTEDEKTIESHVTETGEFRFNGVPAGRYEMTIRGESTEITLKAIDVE